MYTPNILSLLHTISFASHKHRNLKRKNKEKTPYINHPIRVSTLIAEIGKVYDIEPLMAAILHDTLEDTDTTYQELVDTFGVSIADIVKEVTDDKSLPKKERKRLQVINAPNKSYYAKLVKMADKLDNLTDLLNETPDGWSDEIVYGYFIWSYKVIEGLRGTNQGLEQALDEVFSKVIKPNENIDDQLEKYYLLI